MHKGFSIVDVLQSCVSYNNQYKTFKEKTLPLERSVDTKEKAFEIARNKDKIYTGVIWQEDKETYEDLLQGNSNPSSHKHSRAERIKAVQKLIDPS